MHAFEVVALEDLIAKAGAGFAGGAAGWGFCSGDILEFGFGVGAGVGPGGEGLEGVLPGAEAGDIGGVSRGAGDELVIFASGLADGFFPDLFHLLEEMEGGVIAGFADGEAGFGEGGVPGAKAVAERVGGEAAEPGVGGEREVVSGMLGGGAVEVGEDFFARDVVEEVWARCGHGRARGWANGWGNRSPLKRQARWGMAGLAALAASVLGHRIACTARPP